MTIAALSQPTTPGWRTSLRAAVGLYIPWRIVFSLWAAIIVRQFPVTPLPGTDMAQQVAEASQDSGFVADYLIEPWLRWDAGWYVQIARHGYTEAKPGASAFSPLYPALVGGLGRLLGERYLLAGLIVSNAAAIGALALLHRLVALEYTRRLADRMIFYVVVFPSSFYLLAPYTEGLFLLLVLGAFLAAREDRWALAGLLGALATLARWQGVLLVLALGWQYLEDMRAGQPWREWPRWTLGAWRRWLPALWLGLIPLALLGMFAYLKFGVYQPLPWEILEEEWRGTFTWPWRGIARTALAFVGAVDPFGNSRLTLISNWAYTLLFAALLLAGGRKQRLSVPLLIYGWGQLLLPAARLIDGNILQSLSRYVILIFPAFILLAMISLQKRWLHRLLFIGGAALGLVYSTIFLIWRWFA